METWTNYRLVQLERGVGGKDEVDGPGKGSISESIQGFIGSILRKINLFVRQQIDSQKFRNIT